MTNKIVLLITEGEIEEPLILNSIQRSYFNDINDNVCILKYKTNIYALYSKLKTDDFETDLIEILKERDTVGEVINGSIEISSLTRNSIQQTFLFFDYDGQHYKDREDSDIVDNIMQEMLDYFNNETDSGKLYVSYPMVEALQHLKNGENTEGNLSLKLFSARESRNSQGVKYKTISKQFSDFNFTIGYTKADWDKLIDYFIKSAMYLHYGELKDELNYKDLLSIIDANSIYQNQLQKFIIPEKNVLVLSAFPEFILEYFGESLFLDLYPNRSISKCCTLNINNTYEVT